MRREKEKMRREAWRTRAGWGERIPCNVTEKERGQSPHRDHVRIREDRAFLRLQIDCQTDRHGHSI